MLSRGLAMNLVSLPISVLLAASLFPTVFAQDVERPATSAAQSATSQAVELPADFPKDIPIYPGTTLIGAAASRLGMGATFQTRDSPEVVADFCEAELRYQGWTRIKRLTAGPATSITAMKESRRLAIGLTKSADGQTSISVGEIPAPPLRESRLQRDCSEAEPFEIDPIADDGTLTKPPFLLELEELYRNHPNEVAIAEELAEQNYLLGVQVLCESLAVPEVKYPVALRLLREALRLNPVHEGAQNKILSIESTYVSDGKPVPK